MTRLVLEPKASFALVGFANLAIGAGVFAAAVFRWQLDPYDFGRRARGLEHFLTNQEIAFFMAMAGLVAFVIGLAVIVPFAHEAYVLTKNEVHSRFLFSPRVRAWSEIARAVETPIWVRGWRVTTQLVFQNDDGKSLVEIPINRFRQSRDDILAFIRMVRPDLPIIISK